MTKKSPREQRITRHKRIRARVKGTAKCPRLSVFRSQKHLYAQLVDDMEGKVITAISDLKVKTILKMHSMCVSIRIIHNELVYGVLYMHEWLEKNMSEV